MVQQVAEGVEWAPDLLVNPLHYPALARFRLLRRVSGCSESNCPAGRQKRIVTRRNVSSPSPSARWFALRELLSVAKSLLVPSFGPFHGDDGVDWRRAGVARSAGLCKRDPDGAAVGALHVVRSYRPGLVFVRVGNPAIWKRASWRSFCVRYSMADRFPGSRHPRQSFGCSAGWRSESCSAPG